MSYNNFSPTKRGKRRKVLTGIVHIQASYNNTIVTIRSLQGRVFTWSSAGACGFRGARKRTPFAGKTAAVNAVKICIDQGMREARIYVWGGGAARDSAIRRIREAGIRVLLIRDITSFPHNGCRAPKRRRVSCIRHNPPSKSQCHRAQFVPLRERILKIVMRMRIE